MTLRKGDARALGVVANENAAQFRPALVYLSSLAEGSRHAQASALRDAARWLGGDAVSFRWEELDAARALALRGWAGETYAPATANRMLAAVRGVLRACVALETLSRDRLADLCASLGKVRGSRLPRGRALEPGELGAIWAQIDELTPRGKRDAAMLALLYGCGLRRAELCALDVSHVAGDEVTVAGKGRVQRVVPMPADVAARVRRWIWLLTSERYPSGDGPLFPHGLAGGRYTVNAVYARVRVLAKRAGLRELSPHDLRRSYVTELLESGVDPFVVQVLVGHADAETTLKYDRRPLSARHAAVQVLRLPEGKA